jgi:hypothetical protein
MGARSVGGVQGRFRALCQIECLDGYAERNTGRRSSWVRVCREERLQIAVSAYLGSGAYRVGNTSVLPIAALRGCSQGSGTAMG